METKVCSICKIEKNKADFHKRSERPSGVSSACKACRQPQSKHYYDNNSNEKIAASCKYQKENPEKVLANHQNWIKANPDKVKKSSADWKRNNPTKVKASILKTRYKISLEQYQDLLTKQHGVCAICKCTPKIDRVLAVDHDHATGRVRGLLCNSCNLALGMLKDNKETIKSALEYLGSK